MAEREIDPTDPGTSAGGGTPAWLTNPNAYPPTPEPGYKWVWYTADQSPRWIYVPTSWTPPRPATTDGTTTTDGASTSPFTREQRDVLARGTAGNLEGFMGRESYGTDLKARNSVKNTFATIASRYPSKPSSIDKILADPDFKRLFPNAKKAGFDKIDFGGVQSDFESGTPVGIIDVLTAADPATDTARGWWWGYDAGGTGPTTYRPTAPSSTANRPATSTYDTEAWQNQYGRPSLDKPAEERGWKTLGELGFTGEGANETPDDIYRRNQANATENTAQWWDMYNGVETPKYEDNWVGNRARQRTVSNMFKTGAFVFAPFMGPKATTLSSLASAGAQGMAGRPRSR